MCLLTLFAGAFPPPVPPRSGKKKKKHLQVKLDYLLKTRALINNNNNTQHTVHVMLPWPSCQCILITTDCYENVILTAVSLCLSSPSAWMDG